MKASAHAGVANQVVERVDTHGMRSAALYVSLCGSWKLSDNGMQQRRDTLWQ